MLSIKQTKKRKGFTLAEVLITLGIIGVVAAMTIPTLINKTNNAQYAAALKKSYSVLSQTHEQIAGDKDDLKFALSDLIGDTDSEGFANVFISKMKVAKNCGTTALPNTCLGNSIKDLTGNTLNVTDFFGGATANAFITNDGMSYVFVLSSKTCDSKMDYLNSEDTSSPLNQTCGMVLTDINGPNKGPAVLGRDLFFFWISKKGIYPWGMHDVDGTCELPPKSEDATPGSLCAVRVLAEGAMTY